MYEITSVLWARKLFLLLVSISVFVVGTALVLFNAKTTYTARAEVLFDQPALLGNVSGNNVAGKFFNLGGTFCRLMLSDPVAQEISDDTRISVDDVRRELRCDAVSNTMIVEVTATTAHAERSQDLVAAGASSLASAVNDRYKSVLVPPREVIEARVIREADLPGKNPQAARRQLALVAFGALFFGAAFTAAAEPYRRKGTEEQSGEDSREA